MAKLHLQHQGMVKTKALASQLYYWPGITRQVLTMVETCAKCMAVLPSKPIEPLQFTATSRPMEAVSLDLFSHSGSSWLIMADRYTGWPMVKNLRKSTSTTAVTNVLRHWFGLLGIPTALRMDGGPQFKSVEFYNFCDELNIDCDASSPYNSQSNGHAEATVKNMKYLVSKLDNPNALVNDLDLRLLEWRNTPRGSDGLSPAERMFNRRQRTQLPACEAAYDNISAEIKEKDDGKEDTDVNVAKATKK